MTNQELYTKVRNHLLTQNQKSLMVRNGKVDPNEHVCAYRGLNGLRCAIGILIPQTNYQKVFEDKTISVPSIQAAIPSVDWSTQECLLTSLQLVHDEYEVGEWKLRLDRVARDFQLQVEA